jgi:fructokinase
MTLFENYKSFIRKNCNWVKIMIEESKTFKIAGIGEILWDLLPVGKQLGGAPANFAYHAQSLGASSYPVSAVGDDVLGKEIVDQLNDINLETKYIEISRIHPTGTVEVKLDENGKPDFTIHKNVAWDYISFQPQINELAGELDALCFGSLAQRSEISRESIRKMIESTAVDCLRIYDINLRQNYYNAKLIEDSLNQANCFKLNEDEFPIVANMFSITGSENEILEELLSRFELKIIALTKGSEGSVLITPDESSFLKSAEVQVVDTVGAGDAFTAALGVGLLRGLPIKIIHEHATRLSAFVCTQNGATPALTETLRNELNITPF